MIENRLKRLPVSSSIVEAILEGGEKHFRTIKNALPIGTRIIDIKYDYHTMPRVWFILTHPDWEPLEDGDPIPIVESPIFEKL